MMHHDTETIRPRPLPFAVLLITTMMLATATLAADPNGLTIPQIQSTTASDGASPYAGQVVNCTGGIVIHKFPGFRPRLILQDPDAPEGWAGVQVKDWLTGAPIYNQAQIGDRVHLTNVYVEEYVGNTVLQCWGSNAPTLTILSSDNPLPPPHPVAPEEIIAPVQTAYAEAYVVDHRAEKYESMRLIIENIIVTELDLGKATDNYLLQDATAPDDPNRSCWAADYMNADITAEVHHLVVLGRRFCRVQGILEQYTRPSNGWDYYQLLTTATEDFTPAPTADINTDCRVDLKDLTILTDNWQAQNCTDPNWCHHADLTQDTTVNTTDLTTIAQQWLLR